MKTFSKVSSTFYCNNPQISARFIVTDLTSCAVKCLANNYCASFNFGKYVDVINNKVTYYCDVMGTVSNTTLDTPTGIQWDFYVVD